MIHQLRSTAAASNGPLEFSGRLIEEGLLICSCHISNEYSQDSTGISQHNVSVDLQVSFATIAHQNEFALREVSQKLLKIASLSLGSGLEDSL